MGWGETTNHCKFQNAEICTGMILREEGNASEQLDRIEKLQDLMCWIRDRKMRRFLIAALARDGHEPNHKVKFALKFVPGLLTGTSMDL